MHTLLRIPDGKLIGFPERATLYLYYTGFFPISKITQQRGRFLGKLSKNIVSMLLLLSLSNKQGFDHYLASFLTITQSEIDELGEVVISKTKNPGRGVTDECLVRFSTIQDRDFVQSKAPKLAKCSGKAGMRLEIPDHIHWVFKLLEKESWSISQRWPGAKRNIRFDDANRSFFLDVKVVDGQWERIYPAQVQKAMTARKEDGPSKGVSAILGVKPEVLLDGGQQ